MSGPGAETARGAGSGHAVAGRAGAGRGVSLAWLAAAVLALSQVLVAVQMSGLRDRVAQVEAGVEFWEYGQGGCSAPAGGRNGPATGGLVAYRADGTI